MSLEVFKIFYTLRKQESADSMFMKCQRIEGKLSVHQNLYKRGKYIFYYNY
jgi:hypothetical protein